MSVVNAPMNPLAAVESVFDPSKLDATLVAAAEEMQKLARMVRGG